MLKWITGWKPYRTRPVQGLLDKGMIKIIARTDNTIGLPPNL